MQYLHLGLNTQQDNRLAYFDVKNCKAAFVPYFYGSSVLGPIPRNPRGSETPSEHRPKTQGQQSADTSELSSPELLLPVLVLKSAFLEGFLKRSSQTWSMLSR
mmetsp:Transcript_38035/g.100383  ORF Transcript_38035/g.100383 Transcript_38035/m.100383 type:complete len:103 (+) Transcript_38035:54-362(+)